MISINNISKQFQFTKALSDVSCTINKGDVLGILGPNGSGKTTLINLIAGFLKPSSGEIIIDGQNAWEDRLETVKKISYIMETPRFYPALSAKENLEIIRKKLEVHPAKVEELITLVGLNEAGKKSFSTFSLGMKQRLSIAAALLKNPEILIVDEPTNGLDPEGIIQIRELIRSIASPDRILILCSHLISEVEKICNRVIILNDGKIIEDKKLTSIENKISLKIQAPDTEKLEKELKNITQIESIKKQDKIFDVVLQDGFSASDLNKVLSEKNIYLNLIEQNRISLENMFLNSIEKITK